MFRKILGVIGTRYLIAFLNLLLIFINAKVLGADGLGLIGLIIASMNIAVMVNSVLCGNTIVYFMNRYSFRMIFLPAYLWALIGSAAACGIMALIGLIPAGYGGDVYLLAVVNSLIAANSRFLLGKDRMRGFNLTFMLQGGLLVVLVLYLEAVAERQDVPAYLTGLYVANGIAFTVSLVWILPYLMKREKEAEGGRTPLMVIMKKMFAYGLWSSADNLAENCTTRLNYFLIQHFSGLGAVGLLDAGTKISESAWHISRSICFIEYSSIAKTPDTAEQKRITLQLFKLTFCAMTFVMGCILLIPEWVYTDYLFSAEFKGMRMVVVGLSFGVVALGCNSILGHYFIGSGKIRYSTYSSCIGLLTLLLAGYLLIPRYGVTGSAFSTSIAFCAMLAFSLTIFTRQTGARLREFLPERTDWLYLKDKLTQRFSR
ncbi:MAG: polysaccharide biosynthesis C-terminal domain-containing protein [Tannerellaceae bacterium]